MAASEQDILRRYLAQRDAPCPHCGYNLRGLHAPRCPECGMRLTLRDVAGMPEWIPLRHAIRKLPVWSYPLVVNVGLIVGYCVVRIFIPAPEGWFEDLVSIRSSGSRGGTVRVFHVAVGTLCALPWTIEHIRQLDAPFAAWLSPKVAIGLWALTAFHALGLMSLVVSNSL